MPVTSPVVLITGASMGLGEAMAREFARQGYRVVLAARSADRLARLAGELSAAGAGCEAIVLDVTDAASVRSAVEATLARFGGLDVLVCNAGLGLRGAVHRLSLEDLRYVFDVNVLGVVRCVQAAVPAMAARGGGLVITISSVAGRFALPLAGGYAATKHALNALVNAMRVELAPLGIRVLNVHPGYTVTGFSRNARGDVGGYGRPLRLRAVPAEHVARQIVRAAGRPPRDLWTHPRERLAAALAGAVPGLADRILVRFLRRKTGQPEAQ